MTRKPAKVLEKTCPQCGKKYQTTSPQKIYCSGKCRREFWKEKTEGKYKKTCPTCGTMFMTESKNKVYCDDYCREYRHERTCQKCGVVWWSRNPNALYCSSACSGKVEKFEEELDISAKLEAFVPSTPYRPITEETKLCVHVGIMRGQSILEQAYDLDRPVEQIQEVLKEIYGLKKSRV